MPPLNDNPPKVPDANCVCPGKPNWCAWRTGSACWPAGREGIPSGSVVRGSVCSFPRPYKGISFSVVTADLQTGHIGLSKCICVHRYMQGQQYRCPHIVITGCEASSRHILHSKVPAESLSAPALSVVFPRGFASSVGAVDPSATSAITYLQQ